MGYDLHITRQTFSWADDDPEKKIALEEWLDYVKSDPELEFNPTAYSYRQSDSDELAFPSGFAEWINHPLKERPWFDYEDGYIETKNPDEETIMKMKRIAIALNAKVQGDDGEVYDNLTDNIIRDDDTQEGSMREKPWWKFW
jgi:hypothetical protein